MFCLEAITYLIYSWFWIAVYQKLKHQNFENDNTKYVKEIVSLLVFYVFWWKWRITKESPDIWFLPNENFGISTATTCLIYSQIWIWV